MNGLQNIFNTQPSAKPTNVQLNPQQQNVFMQLMGMNEEKRAEVVAQILNQSGITSKEQLQNLIKNTRRKR